MAAPQPIYLFFFKVVYSILPVFDISDHICQPLSAELVSWANYILVMERKHARHLRQHFPSDQDKVLELGTFGGLTEIPDPIGGWTFQFRKCRKQIDKCLTNFIQQLASR